MTVHCVTPNPALDITHHLPSVTLHAVNRVRSVHQRPGGKGVNVARLLASQGVSVTTHGFLGGTGGQVLRDLLGSAEPRVQQQWTAVRGETRRTIALVDDIDTTMLNEPGAPATDSDWEALITTLVETCTAGDVVTVSGSLPPGTTPEHVGDLVRKVKETGARVIVDTAGAPLLAAASAGADVLKPNRDELRETTGDDDLAVGIAALLRCGAGVVGVSLGEEGVVLADRTTSIRARLEEPLRGNPTGAGDALVAALAHGLAEHPTTEPAIALRTALPTAIAWSGAAVLAPVAGEFDPNDATRLMNNVIIEEN